MKGYPTLVCSMFIVHWPVHLSGSYFLIYQSFPQKRETIKSRWCLFRPNTYRQFVCLSRLERRCNLTFWRRPKDIVLCEKHNKSARECEQKDDGPKQQSILKRRIRVYAKKDHCVLALWERRLNWFYGQYLCNFHMWWIERLRVFLEKKHVCSVFPMFGVRGEVAYKVANVTPG